jgi:TonB family protein
MKIKPALVLVVALLGCAGDSFSQTTNFPPDGRAAPRRNAPGIADARQLNLPDFFKVGEITGRIGEARAVYLAKPLYPEEAKTAGAEGKVKVEIVIDEDGSVLSAKAVSGDPLLFEATQTAALKSRFFTPAKDGQKTKVSGHLNYNFLIETPNWFAVVFGLGPVDDGVRPAAIKKALAPDWTEENELLRQFTELKRARPADLRPQIVVDPKTNSGTGGGIPPRIEGRVNIPPVNYEAIGVSQKLIAALQKRLANDPPALWQLNLHLELGRALSIYRDPAGRRNTVAILRQIVQSAPSNADADSLSQLQKLIAAIEKGDRNIETDREISRSIGIFAGNK